MAEDTKTRDTLAADRTKLANQRTLLAFFRTAIMLFASGVTFIKLFSTDIVMCIIGGVLTAAALPCGIIGIYVYTRMNRSIRRHYR